MESRLLKRGETSGRVDDNPESIRKRFKTYQTESLPIVEEYNRSGLVARFDASQAIDDVWRDVRGQVERIERPSEVALVQGVHLDFLSRHFILPSLVLIGIS